MRNTTLVLALFAPLVTFAAPPEKIDFARDVRPLLEQKCFACHGEDVQQSGLRLDKRQNAMRGGDYGPVIIAGDSAKSKLIRRVIDGDGGMRMPPTGPLSKDEIDLLKAWIDQGADFRMEIKPEAPPKPVDPRLAAFISNLRSGNFGECRKDLAANKSLVNAKDAGGSTPLHHAAGFASLAEMKFLIENGADVNAKNRRASTPLHWAIRDEAKVRFLLDKGAAVNARQADGRTPLYLAASLGNGDNILRLLLDKGADPNQGTSNGNTPLDNAAARGDVVAIRLLLAKKADVNQVNGAGGTALMAAAGSRNPAAVALLIESGANVNAVTKKNEGSLAAAASAGDERSVKLLLDKGAVVNIADDRGYTPLLLAIGSEAVPAGIVKLLLAKGADPHAVADYDTAKTLAAKRGDTEVARLLGVSEADRKAAGIAPLPSTPAAPRPAGEAIEKSLALLEMQSHNFIRISGCNSCHSQDLPSSATAIARDRGLRVKDIPQLSKTMNGETPERIMDFVAGGGLGWEMFNRGMNHTPRDFYTDAVVNYTKAIQTPEGYWMVPDGRRPPMNAGDLQATALYVYTLKEFTPPEGEAETKQMLARAASWLEKVKPMNTQQQAFQLLGLAWSGASSTAIEHAAKALAATQRADGGWKQLEGMGSDAYATGQALYALNTAGKMPTSDAVYQKGVQYLLRTQNPDGSWHVKTRAIWVQPYFESGFPHGKDQFISSAGTSWATMALSMTLEAPLMSRK